MYAWVQLLMHSMNGRISAAPSAQFRPRLDTYKTQFCIILHKLRQKKKPSNFGIILLQVVGLLFDIIQI